MKKILLSFIILASLSVKAQSPYMNLQAGYVSDHYTHFDFSAGINFKKEDQKIYPLAELGGKFQLTENKVPQVGTAAIGLEYSNDKYFASASGGIGYVFNLAVSDRYKPNDSTVVYLTKGSDKPSYFSPYASIKAGIYINGENAIPIFIDLSYVGKLVWVGVGIKITF